MTERVRSASTTSAYYRCPKMENDLSPRKTMLVLVIVVGCFAVLWPKVFYPMLVGSANQHIKPSPIDKTTGCCDVISETDVNTIKIMSELCGTIIKSTEDKPLTGKEIVQRCRQEILQTCGIDISVVLQEQVRLGQSVKQILDEVRSLNGSLCLKYNFGVAPWRLGVPHRMTVKLAPVTPHIRQERPHHLRSELVHPAFRERGRAIPQPQAVPPSRPPPRIVEGRPGPVPGMRPTIGGAGHVVPPSKQGTSSMSVIMPIYTIGIVIFFTYTLMRIIFKKQPEGVGGSLYPPIDPDPHFRKEVFESESSRLGPRYSRDNISSKLGDAELDQLRQRLRETELAMERIVEQMSKVPLKAQDLVNGTLSNGDVVKPQDTEEQPTVKVLGMEMTASCEGGKKWSRPDSPVLPTSPPPPPTESVPPPQEIYLEGALPAQSHLLVADSATEPQPTTGEDPAVVLAGKMTLSVISLDSENGADEVSEKPLEEAVPIVERPTEVEKQIQQIIQEPALEPDIQELTTESVEVVQKREMNNDLNEKEPDIEEEYEIEEYELHPLIMKRFDAPPVSKIQIEDLEKQNQESSQSATITEQEIEHTIIQTPLIHLESDESSHSVEVEELEKEVDSLIQEAIESIEQGQPVVKPIGNIEAETTEIGNSLQKTPEQTISLEPQPKTENETICKDSSIQQLEENSKDGGTLSHIEEQLKIATEEVVKLTGMDVDVLDKNDEKSDASAEILSKKVEVENKLEEIQKKIDEKINTDKIEETNKQEIEHSAEQQKTSELQISKSDELVERPSSEIIELITDKESIPVSEEIEKIEIRLQEALNDKTAEAKQINKDDQVSELSGAHISGNTEDKPKPKEEPIEETVTDAERASKIDVNENKEQKSGQVAEIYTDDDELGSDEELVEEIEEIVYEEESDDEEEGSEEEIARLTNRTDSASVQRVNGERSEDVVEESKYTTVSGNTAAENEISDEELTDDEVEDEEEIIEVEDDEEIEDDDYAADESNDVNHLSGESEPEL